VTAYRFSTFGVMVLATFWPPSVRATNPDPADEPMRRFLAQDDTQHPYRAVRRLAAENGDRRGWIEAATEYAPQTGFRYDILSEGGSDLIRNKVLRAVLDGERDAIAQGETARSSIDRANYLFQANGVDHDGLANVLLTPRRKERVLVAGMIFLRPRVGDLVRLQGRLAKNPSWWVKDVEISRSYDRIHGVLVPIEITSTAQLRWIGSATFHMTYVYSEIDGLPVQTVTERSTE
jgi:hypothetical protein